MNIFAKRGNMIRSIVSKYPVIKTMSAYFCINVAADFNEQVIIKKRTKETYDRGKTARIAATCTFVTSPIMFVWIRFIDKFIPGKTAFTVLKKVVADAFLFAPFIVSTFYITTNVLERKKDITEEWKQKFYPTWTTGLCYWPFVQTVNFALIPIKYKTCLYMPTASFIWMNYLCFMKDKKIVHSDDAENEASLQKSNQITVPLREPQNTHTVPNTNFTGLAICTCNCVHDNEITDNCDNNSQFYLPFNGKLAASNVMSGMCSSCHSDNKSDVSITHQLFLQSYQEFFSSFVLFS